MARPAGIVAVDPQVATACRALDSATLPNDDASGKPAESSALVAASFRGNQAAAFPRIPGYEIVAELGRGGMGIVYQARDAKLNRWVALKTILAGNLASCERTIRFMLEGDTIARLRHPNIIQIYGVGQHKGTPYFALEFADAGSLAEALKMGRYSPVHAAALIEQVARAIHSAHLQGIVHRDLKPANILFVSRGDATGERSEPPSSRDHSPLTTHHSPLSTPKISDFGLAKCIDAEMVLTDTGAILGTPGYMAPEQAHSAKPIGPAADIHALGAILYEMVSGRRPFQAKTATAAVLRLVDEEPAPLRRFLPDVPRDLETICLKCLEKEPGRRYASAHQLADDLKSFREGRPIRARRQSPWTRSYKWARRRPVVAGLLAALIISNFLNVVGLTWGLNLSQRLRAAEQESRFHAAARAAAEAEAREHRRQLRLPAEIASFCRRSVQANLGAGSACMVGALYWLQRLSATNASSAGAQEREERSKDDEGTCEPRAANGFSRVSCH